MLSGKGQPTLIRQRDRVEEMVDQAREAVAQTLGPGAMLLQGS